MLFRFYIFCFLFPLFAHLSLWCFSCRICCSRLVQMVIDRECWGFVVALITNMESSALGSLLCFLNSLHPLLFYCTLKPSSLCVFFHVWTNIFLFRLSVLIFVFAFFLWGILCFDFSAEQAEDRGIRIRKKTKEQRRVYREGLLIDRLTH